MKHKAKTTLLVLITIILFSGCSMRTMQPELTTDTQIDNNTAIVLVGVVGPGVVNYIQFCHDSIPCFNYHGLNLSDDVIALPMTIPIGSLELNSYTMVGRPGFYLPNGVGVGYIGISDKPIELNKPGVYYHLTIDTTENGSFLEKPTKELLLRAKEKYGQALSGLKPLNFEWPE